MKNAIILKAILLISGLIAIIIGTAISFFPTVFYAGYGIDIVGNTSLVNELKAPGLALMASGLLIASGAFFAAVAKFATAFAAFLYLTFGVSRILSMAMDGMPADGLVQAAALEMVIGIVCALALVIYRERMQGRTLAKSVA